MAVEAIESADFLTKEQKRDIFFNNAVRFFRWDRAELEQLSWYKTERSAAAPVETAPSLRPGKPSDAGMSEEVLTNAAGLFQRAVDDGDISGAVLLVARHGITVLHEAIGWRDVEKQVPMTLDTLFDIASITKSIVSTGALVLAEQGKLELEAPVANYIPEFGRERSGEIQVRHLMNHTSGLRFTSFGGQVSAEELSRSPDLQAEVARYPEVGPVGTPGEEYFYSNRGYCTLSAVIERASGQRLDEFLGAEVFQPLGMNDTFFPSWHFTSDRLAAPYVIAEGKLTRAESAFLPYPAGYGFAVSTAADLARFCQLYLDRGRIGTKRLLREDSIEEAARASIRTPYLYVPPEAHRLLGRDPVPRWYYMRDSRGLGIVDGYGYGWSVSDDGAFEHAGAAGTFVRVDPSRDLIIVMMTRCANARIPGNEFVGFVQNAVTDLRK
jgi:CubicO group peptidase (beta-lactamase class C family)